MDFDYSLINLLIFTLDIIIWHDWYELLIDKTFY